VEDYARFHCKSAEYAEAVRKVRPCVGLAAVRMGPCDGCRLRVPLHGRRSPEAVALAVGLRAFCGALLTVHKRQRHTHQESTSRLRAWKRACGCVRRSELSYLQAAERKALLRREKAEVRAAMRLTAGGGLARVVTVMAGCAPGST
jgi:hypothetical protein